MQAEESPNRATSASDATDAPGGQGAPADGRSFAVEDRGHRRPWFGLLAGLGVFALLAVPMAWFALFAVASFTGCFIECGQPDVGTGVLWGSLALVLLVLPVLVGVFVARVPLRRGWPWLIGLGGAVALGAIAAQRVI